MTPHPRRIWLCADDYGAAPGVSAAIRELISRRRINATSVMVAAPHFDNEEAAALASVALFIGTIAIWVQILAVL